MDKKDNAERFIFAQVKGFNEDGELEAVASTAAIDRQGEIIEPGAWKGSLPAYRANPVILATHLHRLSDGRPSVIGSASDIDVTQDALVFRMRFAGTELAKEYEQLYREKHMRAFSVGFIPAEGEWKTLTEDGKQKRVWVHTQAELLEISAVPVPANPEALARMVAAMAGGMGPGLREVEGVNDKIDELTKTVAVLADNVSQLLERDVLSPEERAGAASSGDSPDRTNASARDAGDRDKGAEAARRLLKQ